jgi:putative DNA primase/helicase
MRPNQLSERFEIGRYIGKRLLAGKDVAGNFLESPGASALKKLTGHDFLSCERKNSNVVFSIRGMFDAVVTCNSRMRVHLDGDVDAWRRRLMLIRYERPKPKQRVERFAQKLIESEGRGILVWMLEGARRHIEELRNHGDFQLTDKQKERVNSLLDESDSVRVFVQKSIIPHATKDLTTDELVIVYNDFCDDQGWQPRASRKVERLLVDLMMEIHRAKNSTHIQRGCKRARGYSGVTYATTD